PGARTLLHGEQDSRRHVYEGPDTGEDAAAHRWRQRVPLAAGRLSQFRSCAQGLHAIEGPWLKLHGSREREEEGAPARIVMGKGTLIGKQTFSQILWGGPPGPRPAPWPANPVPGRIDFKQGAGPGGPARTRGSAPHS